MRAWHGRAFRRRSRRKGGDLWLAGALGVLLAAALIFGLDLRLRPVVETMAEAKVTNAVTQLLDQAVAEEVQERALTYSDFITAEKDASGRITALTSKIGRAHV